MTTKTHEIEPIESMIRTWRCLADDALDALGHKDLTNFRRIMERSGTVYNKLFAATRGVMENGTMTEDLRQLLNTAIFVWRDRVGDQAKAYRDEIAASMHRVEGQQRVNRMYTPHHQSARSQGRYN